MGCDGPKSVLEDAKVEWTVQREKTSGTRQNLRGWRSATVLDRCWPSGFFFFFLRQRETISEKKRGRKKGMERVNKMLSMANLRRFL